MPAIPNHERLIVVMGMARSGTTIFTYVLCRHPQIALFRDGTEAWLLENDCLPRWRTDRIGRVTCLFPEADYVVLKRPWQEEHVECGTRHGGSAFFMAGVCDLLAQGRVISIDVADQRGGRGHPRVEFLTGNSVAAATLDAVKSRLRGDERVMVVLDSDHHREHVLGEMELYGPLVTPGQYMIVEDTNINGNPVAHGFGPGPQEALDEYLPKHTEFAADRSREKFFVTFHPGGFLLKK